VLAAPPLLALAAYRIGRRLWPDVEGARQRGRSRAAREALRALQRGKRLAATTAATVTTYLQQRLDLPTAEPTPRETAEWLAARGCRSELVAQAARFFEACDAARFAPQPSAVLLDLTASAKDLILAVEAESCPAESH
jgi:hypothetical protein